VIDELGGRYSRAIWHDLTVTGWHGRATSLVVRCRPPG